MHSQTSDLLGSAEAGLAVGAGDIQARLQALHPEARPGGSEPGMPSFS